MSFTEPSDEEIEEIHEEAANAAVNAWGPAGASARNPYAEQDPRHEIWAFAFKNAYATENGQ